MTTTDKTQTADHTTQLDLAAVRDHAAGTERWIRAAAPDGWLPASVCDLFDHDIPAMAEELGRLRDDVAELAQSDAIARATRQMAIDANAQLRAQLLEALDREDDGRTPLSTYVAHLVAQRDALKHALGKGIAGEAVAKHERDEALAELDAYRDGLGQIFLDPPGPRSPRIPGADDGEPVLWLQLTHQGIPVWICPDCVRMSVAESQPATCGSCGHEGDDIGEAFHVGVAFEDDAAVEAEYGATR